MNDDSMFASIHSYYAYDCSDMPFKSVIADFTKREKIVSHNYDMWHDNNPISLQRSGGSGNLQ